MIDVVLNASALQVIERDVAGITLTRRGNRGHEFAVQNVYACAGEEQWIAVSVRHNDDWQALKTVLRQPNWAAALDYSTESADTIDAHLAQWFAGRPLNETVETLPAAGIPAAPVVQPPDVIDNPRCGPAASSRPSNTRCAGCPYPRPPMTGDFVRSPAPLLGQHNGEILSGALGLNAQELERLESEAVIGTWPSGL